MPAQLVDEGREGFFGPVGMNHVERRCVTDHHPQPLECVREKPGRFINVIDGSMACLRGDGQVVWLNRLYDAVQDFLDGSQADGHAQHRGAKGLHHTSAVAIRPSQLPHEGTEPWP